MLNFDKTNKRQVKDYLIKSFKYRQTKKNINFYKNIVELFSMYPKTILQIINHLFELGYWKDYFYLLNVSENQELNNYIYDLLVDRLKKDIICEKNNEQISTLAKWLPRQNSSFDKKLNFVNNFNKLMFPNDYTFTAKKKYRQIISRLNKKLNPIEINLCSKNYKDINLKRSKPLCIKLHYNTLLKNCKEKLYDYYYNYYNHCNIYGFISLIYREELDDFKKEIINNIWNMNKYFYLYDINFLGELNDEIKRTKLLLDISNEIFKKKFMIVIISISLLVSEFSEIDDCIYISSKKVIRLNLSKKENIIDRINTIINNISCYKEIKLDDIENGPDENLIILTHKKYSENVFNNTNQLKYKRIYYWELNEGNFIESKNNKIIKLEGLPYNNDIKESKNLKIIKNIIDNSNELNDNVYHHHYYYVYVISILIIFTIYLLPFIVKIFYKTRM